MMFIKKLSIYILSLVTFLFVLQSYSFASTIYSNDFTSSVADFTQFFGICSPTPLGLHCNTPGIGLLYNSLLPSIKCVAVDIKDPNSIYSYIAFVDDSSTWLNNPVYFQFNESGNLAIRTDSTTSYGPLAFNGLHNYMLCKNGNDFTGYVDGIQQVQLNEINHTPVSFALSYDSTSVTNLVVTDSLPTPTPTPIALTVPLLKQTDPQWKNYTYDKANIWSPIDPTMGTWGCAVTSATMVLKYYNINKLPGQGNTTLNPETLDSWLNIQPDGYIGNGLVNWLAIARLTKQAKSNNPSFAYDALQFKRINSADKTTLLADLTNNQPDILEEPGHFVVANGQNNNGFTINDPYYPKTLLSDYGNTFASLNRFIPSHTDLSYLLFTGSPQLTFSLKDNNNNPVGESYIQQPLQGDGLNATSGNPVQVLSFEQPLSGNYTLTISGSANQTYALQGYLYDVDGNVSLFTQSGVITSNTPNSITIHLDKNTLSHSTEKKIVTFDSFLADINTLYQLHDIKFGTYNTLKALVTKTKADASKHQTIIVKAELSVINLLIKQAKGKEITQDAYQILLDDVKQLQAQF